MKDDRKTKSQLLNELTLLRKRIDDIEESHNAKQNPSEEQFLLKQTEEKLRESEARFREMAELLPQSLFDIDSKGKLTYGKDIEAQLRQAQKLEAVGTLAGGIAHDFNNILTAIIASATLMQKHIDENNPLRRHLDRIFAASERATALTQSILAYSRKQTNYPSPVNLNLILQNLHKLLMRLIPENIDFKNHLTSEDLSIMADVGQMEQVLMNLVSNAVDAMPAGGDLIIKTECVVAGRFDDTNGFGSYAILTIADTGKGMNAKTKERIFEPFFTTKEVGQGSGLGLSMVYGIIKQHNGFIRVNSEPEQGTTIKIYLPLLDVNSKEGLNADIQPQKGGNETILLIEDDKDVRNLLKEMLGSFGYDVIEAIDGIDGVEKFMGRQNEIDLLLTDVMMPRKNGKEAYNEIKKIKSDIKAIFISGYSATATRELLNEGLIFLAKPVSPRELLVKIREALNK